MNLAFSRLLCLGFSLLLTLSCREPYRHSTDSDLLQFMEEAGRSEAEIDRSLDLGISEAWETTSTRLIRLTAPQYLAKVRSAFGSQLQLTSKLPTDLIIEGSIALGTSKSVSTDRDVEQLAIAAEELADLISSQLILISNLHPCIQQQPSNFTMLTRSVRERESWLSCLSLVTEVAAQKLWGRHFEWQEWEHAYRLISRGLELLKRPQDTLTFSLSWLLQSPHFLYRLEETELSSHHLTQRTLAERLSYFLHNGPPDIELLNAHDLQHPQGWRREVDRLFESPYLERGIRSIFNDLWALWRLDRLHLNKDPEIFEHLSAQLGASAKEETLATVWSSTTNREPLSLLLTQRRAYVDRYLAAVYQLPAPSREGFAWANIPEESQRSGLLGQLSFLALNAHPTSTSSTLRGFFVLDKLLCIPPPPPPSGVDTSIPEPTPDRPTLRDRLESHLSEPSCASCHRPMDMIGLAFEGFDSLAQERHEERGVPLDLSGELFGDPIYGPLELAEKIAMDKRLATCLTRRLFRYARTSHETPEERLLMERLAMNVKKEGLSIRALLKAIVLSEGFHGPYIEQGAL